MSWESQTAWKGLLGGHFPLSVYPDSVSMGKVLTLTGKARRTFKRVIHLVFSVGEIQCAWLFWKNFPYCRYTYWVWIWITDIGDKIRIFLSISPKTMRPSNCFKLHQIPVFLLLTPSISVHQFQTRGLGNKVGKKITVLGSFRVFVYFFGQVMWNAYHHYL